jgi:hypothetical protein
MFLFDFTQETGSRDSIIKEGRNRVSCGSSGARKFFISWKIISRTTIENRWGADDPLTPIYQPDIAGEDSQSYRADTRYGSFNFLD